MKTNPRVTNPTSAPLRAKGPSEHWLLLLLLLLKSPQNTTNKTQRLPAAVHITYKIRHFLSASLVEALTNPLRPSAPTHGFSF